MDKRIFSAGIAMLAVGIVASVYLNQTYPVARQGGMSEEDARLLEEAQINYNGLSNLFHIIAAIGFFIMLISFGLKRKKGGAGKIIIQKPAGT